MTESHDTDSPRACQVDSPDFLRAILVELRRIADAVERQTGRLPEPNAALESKAIALLLEDESLPTIKSIADQLDVGRRTLYRWTRFMAYYRAAQKRSAMNRAERRRDYGLS